LNEELQEKTLSDAIASILQQSRGLLIEEGENMVSLGNGIPGNRSGAYFFEDESDDQSVSDISPLIRRPPSQAASSYHTHIVTGYLSAVEAILLVAYMGSLLGLTLYVHYSPQLTASVHLLPNLVTTFCMIHVVVWAVVGIMDRYALRERLSA